jgi:ABC-type multidrug transport system fused ATPase/permease subunit
MITTTLQLPTPTPIPRLYAQVWLHAQGARARLLAALSMLGASQLLKLALPWMAAQCIDAVQVGGRGGLRLAAQWIGAIGLLYLGVWMLHGPARVLERSVALRVRRSSADALYTRLAHAPLAWHDQHHSGDLHHRVAQSSGALYGFTQSQFLYLQNAIHLVGPLLALWLLSSVTGVLALAGVVLIAALVLRFDRALMRLAGQENAAERRYSARLLDFVGNISAVASLRLQQATRHLLDSRLQAVFAPLSRSIVLTEWKWCAVDLLTVGLAWALVVVYAGTATATATAGGTLLIGSLFMVYQYAQQAGGVLCSMAANFQGLAHNQADHASADPIRLAPQMAAPTPLRAGWRYLDVQGLTYAHDSAGHGAGPGAGSPATDGGGEGEGDGEGVPRGGIHGVTLRLRRGERVALVGPSGSGKSTLLRVLAGLYQAQQGGVTVDGGLDGRLDGGPDAAPGAGGQAPACRDAAALATLIPQEAEIFEATVRDNLCFGEPVAESALQRALHASALDEVLAGLPQGLDTPLSERGLNLSGGQRQRLALARGLLAARDSSLLLLDEPTSALDPVIEQHVFAGITHAFAGACIVASVHRLSLLAHFDRIVLMVAGQVVDVGTAAELTLRQPLFRALQQVGSSAHARESGLPPGGLGRAAAGPALLGAPT